MSSSAHAGTRSSQYAVATAALLADIAAPGADGIYDLAITNGLLEVTAAAIPGHRAGGTSGMLPPATAMLDDLRATFGATAAGTTLVPTGEEDYDLSTGVMVGTGVERMVELDIVRLRDAVVRCQAPRHGRGPSGTLTRAAVEALAVLDEHPSLRVLSDHRRDIDWTEGEASDHREHHRAVDFLAILDEEGIEARARAVQERHSRYTREHELQFCPVCGQRSLVADEDAGDSFGYGIVRGTCGVCSYRQSAHATEDLNLGQEFENRWAHQ